jgi:hypothetical protein
MWKQGLIVLAVLTSASLAGADIIAWNCDDDGDGAIVMGTPAWEDLGNSEYRLTMTGVQDWWPAHVQGDFTTDTELDPKVWLIETVENSADIQPLIWTDYHIAIGMTKPFTISNVVAPDDWTWVITPPVAGQQLPNKPPGTLGYVGIVDYYAGTAIAPGDSGDFGFAMTFAGSIAFCTEQIPTPEPATASLLALGALTLLRRR